MSDVYVDHNHTLRLHDADPKRIVEHLATLGGRIKKPKRVIIHIDLPNDNDDERARLVIAFDLHPALGPGAGALTVSNPTFARKILEST